MLSAYARLDADRFAERPALPFEAFATGQRFRHRPGITLSQQENVMEALASFNNAMLHYDLYFAAQTEFGRPLMVSTLTLQRAIGMTTRTFGARRRIVAFQDIALKSPLRDGDTIYAESEVTGLAECNAEFGTVSILTTCLTSDRRIAAEIHWIAEIYRAGRFPGQEAGTLEFQPRFASHLPDKEGTFVEQTGLFFGDFREGETFLHAPRYSFTLTEGMARARMAMEPHPAFTDLDWIGRHGDGQRMSETYVVAAGATASTRTFGRVVANLGWRDIELPNPVMAGDTVEAVSQVLDCRPSRSRPGQGVITVRTSASNQRQQIVLDYVRKLLVYGRGSDTPYAASGY
ncbi:MaoC/PaaZ C-terminal domain-containing protein [Mesorhizobium sp. ArgA1]